MSTSDMKKAREWADQHRNISDHRLNAGVKAAAEVIQSLPDHWIDAEKVREIIVHLRADMDFNPDLGPHVEALESLLAPPLPTLADLIEAGNDPHQYQWMQAEHIEHGRVIITHPGSTYIYYMKTSGLSGGVSHSGADRITPLPDLPRLEWPGSGDAPTVVEQENVTPDQVVAKDICNNEEESLPRPEDVPAGEPWIVEWYGLKWVGVRNDTNIGSSGTIWSLVHMEDSRTRWGHDSEITLVSRLVPEVKP